MTKEAKGRVDLPVRNTKAGTTQQYNCVLTLATGKHDQEISTFLTKLSFLKTFLLKNLRTIPVTSLFTPRHDPWRQSREHR